MNRAPDTPDTAPQPVWIATAGGAAMRADPPPRAAGGGTATPHGTAARILFPNPRNHFEEIANARAEEEARRP